MGSYNDKTCFVTDDGSLFMISFSVIIIDATMKNKKTLRKSVRQNYYNLVFPFHWYFEITNTWKRKCDDLKKTMQGYKMNIGSVDTNYMIGNVSLS